MEELRVREEPIQRRWSDRILIGGQGSVAFFQTGSAGQFPNGEFRPDEARLSVEAQTWRNAFVLSKLNLITREDPDKYFALGELYVDFENVSGLWGSDNLLNLRLGRFYIPFGKEYIVRNPIPNPLISHSLSGVVRYRDDDSAARNERDVYYYYLEGKQDLTGSFYAAARFSQIHASDGFLIVGYGDRGTYFFSPSAPLTRRLWRMSFGIGYAFSPDLVAKIEVAREDGRLMDGTRRRDHDFAGAQLAFRF